MNDSQLLDQFVREDSQQAFQALVERHTNHVYRQCLLGLNGDTHLAEDGTQAVFIILAKKASTIRQRESLAGWLHRTAHSVSANMVRTAVRRRQREEATSTPSSNTLDYAGEEIPWHEIQPHLPDAIASLSPKLQDALVLHFLVGKSQREIADEAGCTPEAITMRIKRGLVQLRKQLTHKGIILPVSVLTTGLSNEADAALQVAPERVTETYAGVASALSGNTTSASLDIANATLKVMALKPVYVTGLAATIVVFLFGAPLLMPPLQSQPLQHAEQPPAPQSVSSGNATASLSRAQNVSRVLANMVEAADTAERFKATLSTLHVEHALIVDSEQRITWLAPAMMRVDGHSTMRIADTFPNARQRLGSRAESEGVTHAETLIWQSGNDVIHYDNSRQSAMKTKLHPLVADRQYPQIKGYVYRILMLLADRVTTITEVRDDDVCLSMTGPANDQRSILWISTKDWLPRRYEVVSSGLLQREEFTALEMNGNVTENDVKLNLPDNVAVQEFNRTPLESMARNVLDIHEATVTGLANISTVSDAIWAFAKDHQRVPQSVADIPKIDAFDHWGTPFIYEKTHSGFTVVTAGKDRLFGTGDDGWQTETSAGVGVGPYALSAAMRKHHVRGHRVPLLSKWAEPNRINVVCIGNIEQAQRADSDNVKSPMHRFQRIQQLHDDTADKNVRVLVVNQTTNQRAAASILAERKFNFPVMFIASTINDRVSQQPTPWHKAEQALVAAFDIKTNVGTPSFIVDQNGTVVYHSTESFGNFTDVRRFLRFLGIDTPASHERPPLAMEPTARVIISPITKNRLQQIADALPKYHHANGLKYPDSLEILHQEQYWVQAEALVDEWGQPIVYRNHGTQFELFSLGPDGRPGTKDDIVPVSFGP